MKKIEDLTTEFKILLTLRQMKEECTSANIYSHLKEYLSYCELMKTLDNMDMFGLIEHKCAFVYDENGKPKTYYYVFNISPSFIPIADNINRMTMERKSPLIVGETFETLRVKCPICGGDSFHRFREVKDRDWMCINPDCEFTLRSTE